MQEYFVVGALDGGSNDLIDRGHALQILLAVSVSDIELVLRIRCILRILCILGNRLLFFLELLNLFENLFEGGRLVLVELSKFGKVLVLGILRVAQIIQNSARRPSLLDLRHRRRQRLNLLKGTLALRVLLIILRLLHILLIVFLRVVRSPVGLQYVLVHALVLLPLMNSNQPLRHLHDLLFNLLVLGHVLSFPLAIHLLTLHLWARAIGFLALNRRSLHVAHRPLLPILTLLLTSVLLVIR